MLLLLLLLLLLAAEALTGRKPQREGLRRPPDNGQETQTEVVRPRTQAKQTRVGDCFGIDQPSLIYTKAIPNSCLFCLRPRTSHDHVASQKLNPSSYTVPWDGATFFVIKTRTAVTGDRREDGTHNLTLRCHHQHDFRMNQFMQGEEEGGLVQMLSSF